MLTPESHPTTATAVLLEQERLESGHGALIHHDDGSRFSGCKELATASANQNCLHLAEQCRNRGEKNNGPHLCEPHVDL